MSSSLSVLPYNGTFVNGQRIEQFDLRSGDLIALGRVVLRYLEA